LDQFCLLDYNEYDYIDRTDLILYPTLRHFMNTGPVLHLVRTVRLDEEQCTGNELSKTYASGYVVDLMQIHF
jgi:hypothetical protein